MITALGPRLGLGLRLDFGSQVWFVQYFSEKKVIVLYAQFSGKTLSDKKKQVAVRAWRKVDRDRTPGAPSAPPDQLIVTAVVTLPGEPPLGHSPSEPTREPAPYVSQAQHLPWTARSSTSKDR